MTAHDSGHGNSDDDFIREHGRFEFDDAAYLLGALDADETAAYEHHLRTCPYCQDSVAELSALPDVLARADSSAWVPESPPDTLLPRLLRQVAAGRRQRVRRSVGIGLAAACLAALLLVAGMSLHHGSDKPQPLAMQSVGSTANPNVDATVTFTGSGKQTRIELECGYHGGGTNYPGGVAPSYRMIVFNRLGQMRDLGSWTPAPGEDVEIARNSPWAKTNISKIVVSDGAGNPVLQLVL